LLRTGCADLIEAAGVRQEMPTSKPDTCMQTVSNHSKELAKRVGSIHALNPDPGGVRTNDVVPYLWTEIGIAGLKCGQVELVRGLQQPIRDQK
jgi:hypothetical protein